MHNSTWGISLTAAVGARCDAEEEERLEQEEEAERERRDRREDGDTDETGIMI